MIDLDQFDQPPSPALLSPAVRQFQGKPLFAYTFSRKVLSRAPIGENPARVLLICATLFVLTLPDLEVQEALCDVKAFSKRLFAWFDTLSVPDFETAAQLSEEITQEALAAEVKTPADPGELGPKKNT